MPAFGSPTSPMSAISRSSRRSQRSSPGSPFWACFGAWWVEVAKWVLPRPPRPPRATIAVWPTRDEVGDQLAGRVVEDGRPGRDVEDEVVAGLAVPPRALAAAAGVGLEVVLVLEVAERRLAGVDAQVDRAAAAAVTAVGAAARDVGLAPERRGPVAAVAGTDEIFTRSRNIGPIVASVVRTGGPCRPSRRTGPSDVGGSEVAERVDAVAAALHGCRRQTSKWRCGPVAQPVLPDPADLLAARRLTGRVDR